MNANAGKLVILLPYAIGQQVKIRAIDKVGRVYSINVCRDGLEYRVRWWNEEVISDAWMLPDEIEAA
jgi:hypothetical protein